MKIIDHAVEEAHWKENHPHQPFAGGTDYEDYRHAYRAGYEGFDPDTDLGLTFEDVAGELQMEYEGGVASLEWEKAHLAARAAWERARDLHATIAAT